MNAKEIIKLLNLIPHPEGGFYKETFRSAENMITPEGNQRSVITAIYFLLENEEKSLFHRIKSDEMWFFHQGEPLEIFYIQNQTIKTILLGNNLEKGEIPQARMSKDTWFGSRVKNGHGFSFVSCTVAPGFDFLDFEMASRTELMQEFPNLKESIEYFTAAE